MSPKGDMLRFINIVILMVAVATQSWAQEVSSSLSPKLVVNIVVGGMRAGDIERYRHLFGESGFLQLQKRGVNFTSASYPFSPLSTSASLATLTTGASPSTHGVVGDAWWDRISSGKVYLTHSTEVKSLNYHLRQYSYSADRLIAPTLTDVLLSESRGSKSISISLEPTSAIVMSSDRGVPYWIDALSCEWGSSTAFMKELPSWVETYNKSSRIPNIANEVWSSKLPKKFYVNSVSTTLKSNSMARKYESAPLRKGSSRIEQIQQRYNQLQYTPAGNRAILEFARQTIENERLGNDTKSDVLNIYLDPARYISQRYGVSSVEVEDMYCHLDAQIGEFLEFLSTHIFADDIVVTLTSDHGMNPAYGDNGQAKGYFDSKQFVVVVNSFLRARYGGDNWIIGYERGNIYLDHREIFSSKQSVESVQNEVASFALQFRGVSHAFSATALRNASSTVGVGEVVQQGFYPRRSGDVILLLMPGWIEQVEGSIASGGSAYRYDRYVPFIIYSSKYTDGERVSREVDMISFAPTLAHILRISPPLASESRAIAEIEELF